MGVSRGNRTVGLDKPCRVCGKPVHYTYAAAKGGVCGRCADRRRPKGVRPYHRGMVLERGAGRRSGPAVVVLKIVLALVAGAAAVAVALRYLLG